MTSVFQISITLKLQLERR